MLLISSSSRREILPPSTAKSVQITIRFLIHTDIVFYFLVSPDNFFEYVLKVMSDILNIDIQY